MPSMCGGDTILVFEHVVVCIDEIVIAVAIAEDEEELPYQVRCCSLRFLVIVMSNLLRWRPIHGNSYNFSPLPHHLQHDHGYAVQRELTKLKWDSNIRRVSSASSGSYIQQASSADYSIPP